jgi:hypothetical protein
LPLYGPRDISSVSATLSLDTHTITMHERE